MNKISKILLIDVDLSQLEVYAGMLRHEGYVVFAAPDTNQGLGLIRSEKPQMVLLGGVGPDLSRTEICRIIKSDPALADVFVVLFDGPGSTTADRVAGLTAGADDAFSKALEPVELLARIATILRLRHDEVVLKERCELGQRIIGTVTEGFWMLDMEGNIVDVNETYCRMSGYSRQELLKLHVSDLEVKERTRAQVVNHIESIVRLGSDRFETRHRRKNGRIIEVEVVANFLQLREKYVFAFLRDFTERKRVEEKLKASEEQLRQLTENIREVFWITDPAKKQMIYVSPGYEAIWGQTCESLYAAPGDWIKTIHPDDSERVRKAVQTKQATGEYDETYRIVRPDGSTRWIHDRAFPIRRRSGRVYRVVGIAEDITEHWEAQHALQESEARKSALMEAALDAIINFDQAGSIIEVNSAALKLLGLNRTKCVGQQILNVIQPSLRSWFQSGLENSFGNEGGPALGSRIEMPALRSDGSEFPAEFAITRIPLPGSSMFTAFIRDISGLKRVEEELRLLSQRAIEAQEAERLRVARDLHDGVNQIIASAKMRLHNLEKMSEDLDAARRAILSRSIRLLDQALDENRRIAHNLRPVELDELGFVTASRNYCKRLESHTNLSITCRFARLKERLPSAVELNFFRILQEVLNNVEKHARAKAVNVQMRVSDHEIVLRIQDDGCGFDPLRRRTVKGRWSGVGLASIRERAIFLGGECQVRSMSKKGTTVLVRAPWNGNSPLHLTSPSTQQTA